VTPLIPAVGSVLDDMDALVPPRFWHCPEYVDTLGPEVAALVELFGRVPNPEQRLLLDGSFGMDRTGRLSAFEVFVLASRQNLKTGFLTFRALGKALVLERPLQLWTAHKESATEQAFRDIKEMIAASDELSRRVRALREGKGDREIQFVNGCRIVMRPRTGKAGQSMSTDDVDMDEYFAVEPKHLGSLVPTLSTRPKAQIGEASSAPHAESHEQRAVMRRGRAAALGLAVEPRLLYAEWSPVVQVGSRPDGSPRFGPPPCAAKACTHAVGVTGCIADDREVIKMANPSVGRSAAPAISWDYIGDERRKLDSPDALVEYWRERLSLGDEGDVGLGVTVFGAGRWEACSADAGVRPAVPIALGVAVSADRDWASIAAAALVELDEDDETDTEEPTGPVYVTAVDRREGVDWLAEELKRIQDETDCVIVIDEKGPTKDLLVDLEDADVAVETLTLDQYAEACSRFYDKVRGGVKLLHPSAEDLADDEVDELGEAVEGAEWRQVGDRRVWGRRQSVTDVSMLEAATLAAFGAEKFGW